METIRVPEVLRIIGVSRPTLYRWLADGSFPKGIKLGPRVIGWDRAEVEAWREAKRTAGRDAA